LRLRISARVNKVILKEVVKIEKKILVLEEDAPSDIVLIKELSESRAKKMYTYWKLQ